MKVTYGQLRQMVEESLKEQNVSGAAGGYMTPKAFRRKISKIMQQGMKPVLRPKRPSHTKMFDYLEETKKNNE